MAQIRGFFQYIRRNIPLGIGLGILLFLILFTAIGFTSIDPKVDPYPLAAPASLPPTLRYCPASDPECEDPKAYPFGTDGQGRDLYAVAVTGTWMEMRIGVFAGVFGIVVGTIIGFTAAFWGGWYDTVVRILVDVLLTIPALLILVVIQSSLARRCRDINGMAIIIALVSWRWAARVIRSQVLSMREREYVRIARLNGMSDMGIIFRELMPNLLPYLGAALVGAVTAAIFASIGLGGSGAWPTARADAGCDDLLGLQPERLRARYVVVDRWCPSSSLR